MKAYFIFFLLFSNWTWAQIPILELSRDHATLQAKQKSEKIKSSLADSLAADEQAEATHTFLLPRLTFDANYRFIGVVPSISLPLPGVPPITMGAHSNYSIGPTLSYTLWDSGAIRDAYRSQLKLAGARKEDLKNAEVQLIGEVKNAYTKVQLGLEQLKFVKDSFNLSKSQNQDITHRFKAGTATRLDLLTSEREVLNYELQFKQQQASLGASLRDLLTLINDTRIENPSKPSFFGDPTASVWLKLDSIENSLMKESSETPEKYSEDNPQMKSRQYLVESLEFSSESQKAASYPQIQLSARTSLDYPNGPILETINQNTLTATLSMPLFEFNRNQHQIAEKEKEAESNRYKKNQLNLDMQRDFSKAKEYLRSLNEQQKDAEESVRQSEMLARLNYESYQNGKITLVDVQAANIRALQAKVELAQIRALILNQIVILKTLAGRET